MGPKSPLTQRIRVLREVCSTFIEVYNLGVITTTTTTININISIIGVVDAKDEGDFGNDIVQVSFLICSIYSIYVQYAIRKG